MDKPMMVEILNIVDETPVHRSFILDVGVDAVPGQFCMLWIPGLNEKPMSFSGIGDKTRVTVKKIGEFTKEMFKLKAGDKIGFRGPYGNGFTILDGYVCLVGGGCGIAPLSPLADIVGGKAIIAAKNESELMLVEEFKSAGLEVVIATDDGSSGVKGFAHEALASLLDEKSFDCIYSCGPELMMKGVYDLCCERGIECQLSLERYMKCGIGICGSCTISGKRVCMEGPVFEKNELKGTEFGEFTRDECGVKKGLK